MVRKLVFWLILASAMAPAMAVHAQFPTVGTPMKPAAPTTASAASPAPTPVEAQATLDTLQDPQKLHTLIQTLQTIAKATPAPAPAAKPASAAPALALAPNSLGAQLLPQVTTWTGRLAGAAAATVTELSQAPAFWRAMMHAARDPDERLAAADAVWRIVVVLVCAAIGEIATRWVLRRPLRSLEAHATWPDQSRNAWDTLRRL